MKNGRYYGLTGFLLSSLITLWLEFWRYRSFLLEKLRAGDDYEIVNVAKYMQFIQTMEYSRELSGWLCGGAAISFITLAITIFCHRNLPLQLKFNRRRLVTFLWINLILFFVWLSASTAVAAIFNFSYANSLGAAFFVWMAFDAVVIWFFANIYKKYIYDYKLFSSVPVLAAIDFTGGVIYGICATATCFLWLVTR